MSIPSNGCAELRQVGAAARYMQFSSAAWAHITSSRGVKSRCHITPHHVHGPYGGPKGPMWGGAPHGPYGAPRAPGGHGEPPRGLPRPGGTRGRGPGRFLENPVFGSPAAPRQTRKNCLKTGSPASGTYLNRSGLLFWSRWVSEIPREPPWRSNPCKIEGRRVPGLCSGKMREVLGPRR